MSVNSAIFELGIANIRINLKEYDYLRKLGCDEIQ